jgi:hypothetical protein
MDGVKERKLVLFGINRLLPVIANTNDVVDRFKKKKAWKPKKAAWRVTWTPAPVHKCKCLNGSNPCGNQKKWSV